MFSRKALLCVAALLSGISPTAMAQTQSSYAPVGQRVGSFRLFPELAIGAEYIDNALASTSPEEDVIYDVNPKVTLRSNWSRHMLNLSAEADHAYYAEFDDQNISDYRLGAEGRLDVDSTLHVSSDLLFADLDEPLNASPILGAAGEPVNYRFGAGLLRVSKNFDRIQVTVEGRRRVEDFDDTREFDGTPVEQDDRDHSITSLHTELAYAVGDRTAAFVAAQVNQIEYDVTTSAAGLRRDSDGYDVLGGVRFGVTDVLVGQAGVGYLQQTYDELGVPDSKGVAVLVSLNWRPDSLIDINLGATRAVRPGQAFGAVSYIENSVNFSADYAYRRNVDLRFASQYSSNEQVNIDGRERRWSVRGEMDYKLNRLAGVFVALSHEGRDDSRDLSGLSYNANRVAVGLRLQR